MPWHFQILADQLTLLNQRGQIISQITTGNPGHFKPSYGPGNSNAISASISSNVLHQRMLTSKLILDNEIAAFGESLGFISYMHISKSHSIIVNLD